jgi:hypothetical protein
VQGNHHGPALEPWAVRSADWWHACPSYIRGVQKAQQEILANPYIWQPIIQKYSPGFITHWCSTPLRWRRVSSIKACMFHGDPDAAAKIKTITDELGSNRATQTHSRHIHKEKAKSLGLKIVDLEGDEKLQDAVLSVHHACMITFEQAGAFKMIENHAGNSYIQAANMMIQLP